VHQSSLCHLVVIISAVTAHISRPQSITSGGLEPNAFINVALRHTCDNVD
jgi:hypothetical protein